MISFFFGLYFMSSRDRSYKIQFYEVFLLPYFTVIELIRFLIILTEIFVKDFIFIELAINSVLAIVV